MRHTQPRQQLGRDERMLVGLAVTATDLTMHPAQLAREVERRGFAALFLPEHSHIPVSRQTAFPGGGNMPMEYARTHDPFVWLSFAAGATEHLWLGTGVCLVAEHDPIQLAKQVASLDVLSSGRLIFGIGYGWNQEELADHGAPGTLRHAIVRESVLAMRNLWENDVASYDGQFVHLAPSWAWPKPLQSPHPLIMLGASASPIAVSHLVEYCDGWMMYGDIDVSALGVIRSAAREAGRDAESVHLAVHRVPASPAALARFEKMGVELVTLTLPSSPEHQVLRELDNLALVAQDYLLKAS